MPSAEMEKAAEQAAFLDFRGDGGKVGMTLIK